MLWEECKITCVDYILTF